MQKTYIKANTTMCQEHSKTPTPNMPILIIAYCLDCQLKSEESLITQPLSILLTLSGESTANS